MQLALEENTLLFFFIFSPSNKAWQVVNAINWNLLYLFLLILLQ